MESIPMSAISIHQNTLTLYMRKWLAAYATIDWTWGKRHLCFADGEDDGNSRFSSTVGFNIVAFSSEPVNGKHLAVWLVKVPQDPSPRTVGMLL